MKAAARKELRKQRREERAEELRKQERLKARKAKVESVLADKLPAGVCSVPMEYTEDAWFSDEQQQQATPADSEGRARVRGLQSSTLGLMLTTIPTAETLTLQTNVLTAATDPVVYVLVMMCVLTVVVMLMMQREPQMIQREPQNSQMIQRGRATPERRVTQLRH